MTAIYTWDVFSTLDGYGSYSPDGIDWGGYWSKQGPELLEHRAAQFAGDQRLVFGATTFCENAGIFAEGLDPHILHEWNRRSLRKPTTVFSSTLQDTLGWPDATIVREDAATVVARMEEEADVPIRSQASLSLNWSMLAAGLVDQVQVTIFPVITRSNGISPIFGGTRDFDLELLDAQTLDGHTQQLTYRPTAR